MSTMLLKHRINHTVNGLTRRHFASNVQQCDALVLGGGIAGASTSYQLAKMKNLKVICIEKEKSPGYHATGRAHGLFSRNHARTNTGKILTKYSRPFYDSPDAECIDSSVKDMRVLKKVGLVAISSPADYQFLYKEFGPLSEGDRLKFSENIKVLPRSDVMNYLPFINESQLAEYGIHQADAADFNTGLAYEHFLIGGSNVGVQYEYNSIAVEINKQISGNWEVLSFNPETQRLDRFEAPIVINCGGRWLDEITKKAGLKPFNIIAHKRHVIVFSYGGTEDLESEMVYHSQKHEDKEETPWVGWISPNIQEIFYSSFHTKSGVFLFEKYVSIGDDTDCEGDDDEMEICLHKIHKYTNLKIKQIAMKTAGIKASVADDLDILVGPHYDDNSFIVVGGLGSIGIQSAPAYSQIAACLAVGDHVPSSLIDLGIDIDNLLPSRLQWMEMAGSDQFEQ